MICTVDVGNSNIVGGVYREAELVAHWRLSTRPYRTGDELRVTIRELLREDEINTDEIDQVVLSSVVPPVTDELRLALERLMPVTPFLVTPSSVPWLEIGTESRNEMGPDLMANAIAGGALAEGYVSVIDFGTAMTITTIGPRKEVLGVSIAPGLAQASVALSSGTARLPQVALEAPPRPFGTNTVEAIQSGLVHGYAAMVEGMIARLEKQFDAPVTAIATGGLSSIVAPLVGAISHVDPWLTLSGLRMIAERQASK